MLKTSRFSEDGKLMPLVGKTLGLVTEALGPELSAVAGPVGLLATAAEKGAEKLHDLAVSAAASGVAFNDRANALGSPGPSAGMVGALAGVDGAGQASAYNSAISGGGLGTYAGYREGQYNLGNPLVSKLDIGKIYWDAMEARRHMSREDQLRQAQMTNTMGSMPLMSLSEQQWQIAKQQGLAQSGIMAGTAGPSVDFQQSEAGLKAATDNLTAALGAPLLKPLTDFENGLAGAVNGLAGLPKLLGGRGGALVSGASSALKSILPVPVQAALGGIGAISASGAAQGTDGTLGANSPAQPFTGKSETATNTEATNKLTAQMRELAKAMPGTFGAADSSGRRAAALPSEAYPDGNHPGRIMGLVQLMSARIPLSQFA